MLRQNNGTNKKGTKPVPLAGPSSVYCSQPQNSAEGKNGSNKKNRRSLSIGLRNLKGIFYGQWIDHQKTEQTKNAWDSGNARRKTQHCPKRKVVVFNAD